MDETPTPKPEDVLNELLNGLRSEAAAEQLNAIRQLTKINFSSEAIRNELEKLAARDADESVRREALAALDLPAQRNVRRHFNKVDRLQRRVILEEIADWEKFKLLEKDQADVLRRRYDFDFVPAPKVASAPSEVEGQDFSQTTPEPVPAGPRPTLTQILLSESNIKISLYLGAFFVIASAAILGAFVDIFRIPLLILGTIVFGGLSVAIRKRLPQPSFALFIVFSFFLPITANVVEDMLSLSTPFSAAYWVVVGLLHDGHLGRRNVVVHLAPVQPDSLCLVGDGVLPHRRYVRRPTRILLCHAGTCHAYGSGWCMGTQKMAGCKIRSAIIPCSAIITNWHPWHIPKHVHFWDGRLLRFVTLETPARPHLGTCLPVLYFLEPALSLLPLPLACGGDAHLHSLAGGRCIRGGQPCKHVPLWGLGIDDVRRE